MHTLKLFLQITDMYMECSSDQSSDLHEIDRRSVGGSAVGGVFFTIRLDGVRAGGNRIFDEGSESTGAVCFPRVAGAQLEREHE